MEVNFESTDKKMEIGIKSIESADNYYEIPIEDITNKLKNTISANQSFKR